MVVGDVFLCIKNYGDFFHLNERYTLVAISNDRLLIANENDYRIIIPAISAERILVNINEKRRNICMKENDLEEIELNEEPVGPTTADLCKQWFIELCNDVNIKKYHLSSYDIYVFGSSEESRSEYPFMRAYNDRYSICYKEYSASLLKEDGENLLNLFNKSNDAYYNNLFKSKLDLIEMTKRREKLYKRGSVIQIEYPSYGGKSR